MDVLVQHLVTIALGGGFAPDELYDEVRSTAALCRALARELAAVPGFRLRACASLAA